MDVRCWLQEEVNAFIRLTLSTRSLSSTGLFTNTVSILQLGFFSPSSHRIRLQRSEMYIRPDIHDITVDVDRTPSFLSLVSLVSLVTLLPLVFCISPIHSISKSQLGSFTPKSVVVQTRSFRIIS